ncbi:AbiH family protein [Anaerophaga thermohalophila]|uniref:AbiH family protein n=1 Tax=Anaerophaga thermohalophila TaxID=177400 RepID=UPI000237D3AA|nr:AbiH family protein [Anaerophaga thermohalophila]
MPHLYLTGNGFDLHHNMKSSYNHFRKYLLSVDPQLVLMLEAFINCRNLWGDFEKSLAFLDRERVMETVDAFLPEMQPDSEDFKAADFYLATGQVNSIVWSFTNRLKYRFFKWIRSLNYTKGHRNKLLNIDANAFFINFNYTPLIEDLYDIPRRCGFAIHIAQRNGFKIRKSPPVRIYHPHPLNRGHSAKSGFHSK